MRLYITYAATKSDGTQIIGSVYKTALSVPANIDDVYALAKDVEKHIAETDVIVLSWYVFAGHDHG